VREGKNMKRITAMALGILLITLGVSGVALAQNVVQLQGTIQSVDCQTYTLVLREPNGVINTVSATNYTGVFVNGGPASFCGLQQYVGSYATASLAAAGNQLIVGRIDVAVGAATPYYYPYPYDYYYPYGYYGPPLGIGIGIGVGRFHHFHRMHFRHFRGTHFAGPARGMPPIFRTPARGVHPGAHNHE
jgi:hypothetical protein